MSIVVEPLLKAFLVCPRCGQWFRSSLTQVPKHALWASSASLATGETKTTFGWCPGGEA